MENHFAQAMITYCKHNTSFVYNQNFASIMMGILEVVYKAKKAFWLFTALLENILPEEYFTNDLYP